MLTAQDLRLPRPPSLLAAVECVRLSYSLSWPRVSYWLRIAFLLQQGGSCPVVLVNLRRSDPSSTSNALRHVGLVKLSKTPPSLPKAMSGHRPSRSADLSSDLGENAG